MSNDLLGYQKTIYTPEMIISREQLPANGIYGFGSNREGRHGLGGALTAVKVFDAVYGQAEGLQGQSYAIITKELRYHTHPKVTLMEVEEGIAKCLAFFAEKPELELYMTKIGCKLAGFTTKQIGDIFRAYMPLMPPNIVLPKEFT